MLNTDEKDRYEQKIKDLRELIDISKSLNSNLSYATLLDSLLLTCMGRAMVVKAGLFIRHNIDSTDFTLYRNYEGFNPDKNVDFAIPEKSDLIMSLKKAKGCLTMPELLNDIRQISDIKPFTILEPSLIIPIVMKKDLQGIIVLGERITGTGFSDEEKVFLRNVADLGAIAIHNTFLLEVSSTDMMTHLKQKHILLQHLRDLFANYNGENITILMMDIDHFKGLNDTYGHSFGDTVLKEVASIILKNVRVEDMAARYGGEEFTIVLRYIDNEVALKIAERIRSTIEQKEFIQNGQIVKTSISIGLAGYNRETDLIPVDLIERADSALYKAKENGRNRIEVYEF
ncbi:sensor domain-containing diguanylate cyclase [Spirochaeta isovalerica]|uniref:diguanylate cyclase n=1 Tax=Spirochaeta isovalerica TaxID=150 RepID=A0A841R8Q7_9SPIO|nr:sensor domain-containing diguanylate cyclase [Spirochaeta isovalerica]MBB6478862.1 diguanylate cyclase (GGDEF)-like protein [Spirochaeta isovalerica]